MSFGVQIENFSGEVVIDGEHPNHVYQESGSGSRGGDSGDNVVSFGASYGIDRQPLIFARSTSFHVGFQKWTFDGSGNVNGFVWANRGAGSFDWRLFATPGGPSADTWGLRIYGSAGQLVYDSGLDYVNIADVIAVPSLAGGVGLNTGNKSHASASEAWYCITSAAAWGIFGPPMSRSRAFSAWKAINGTTVDLNWAFPDLIGGSGNVGPIPSSMPLIVADLG